MGRYLSSDLGGSEHRVAFVGGREILPTIAKVARGGGARYLGQN